MESSNEAGKSAFVPAPSAAPDQQHPLPFKPVVSPLARAQSHTSLGAVVTPTKGRRGGHLVGEGVLAQGLMAFQLRASSFEMKVHRNRIS